MGFMKHRGMKLGAAAIVFALMACVFLLFAIDGVPENPGNPSDTSGLPPVAMYVVILFSLVGVSSFLSCLGGVGLIVMRYKAYKLRLFIYALANLVFMLTAILGVLVSGAYTYDTFLGILGLIFYALTLVLLVLAAPKKQESIIRL
ncbi:hypothetical protein [Pseudomonas phage DVM-2008]|nr:hypothetical protein [Pseudomonas phage DVM-2008]EIK70830.1 hypothetical protein PflQ8_1130 [Pseudomonas fluorescens Q8r1-96]